MVMLFLRILSAGLIIGLLNGCPMDPTYPRLRLRNNSDTEIMTLINHNYPDSSLKRSGPDSYLEPHTELYIGIATPLDIEEGLTVFIFDHGYFRSKWHEHPGTPDKYLEEDHILKKFYHSKEELDSLGWRLVYP